MTRPGPRSPWCSVTLLAGLCGHSIAPAAEALVVRGGTVHTMAGEAIRDGVVIVIDGKIAAVGPAATVAVPAGAREIRGTVVTPGSSMPIAASVWPAS